MALLDADETPGEELEPSLGAPEQHTASIFFRDGTWHTLPADQTRWAAGGTDEREGDLADAADDREGGDVLDDGEETLGWCENVSQEYTWGLPSAFGRDEDCEYDPAESGIGDADRLAEQMSIYDGIGRRAGRQIV